MSKFFHPRWTFRAFWVLWRLAFVAGCFFEPVLPGHVWSTLLGLFVLVEAWGVLRKSKGDTLSETHWAVGARGWAWRLWSVGCAGAYAWQAWRLPDLAFDIEPGVAWGFICAGLFGWLGSHFFWLGEHG